MPFGSIIGIFESISEDFEVFSSLRNDRICAWRDQHTAANATQ